MLDIFVEHNQTWGVIWQAWEHKSGEERRGGWCLLSEDQYFHPPNDEPSFHEQLEARLELRAWLQGKASAQQIEDWLGN